MSRKCQEKLPQAQPRQEPPTHQAALFEPLPPEKIQSIVHGATAGRSWRHRLSQQTSLATPDQLAAILTQDLNGQKTPAQLANVLKDHVQGVASTARRIARTESMRIAHESRMEAYEDLGDMVIGYQIHATMDSRVRPHHAARSGTIYYKQPGQGQESATRMPRPPLEENGTVAFGCRCWITPVLKVLDHIENDPAAKAVFSDHAGNLIPNPAVYTDWFDRAPEADKARVVGARRLKLMRDQLRPGEKISWGHFVHPGSGQLMDHDTLSTEHPDKRKKRLGEFDALISQRKELTHQVYTYGYVPPPPATPAPVKPPAPPPPPPTLPILYKPSIPKPAPITTQTAEAHFAYTPSEARRFLERTARGTPPLRQYLGVGHSKINDVLRQGLRDPASRRVANGLTRVMNKLAMEIPVGTVLYRAMPNIKPTKDKGFMSTSLSLKIAREFDGLDAHNNPKKVYTIKVVSPIKGIYIPGLMRHLQGLKPDHNNIREEEILLPRDMKLKITGVQLPDGTWEAYL